MEPTIENSVPTDTGINKAQTKAIKECNNLVVKHNDGTYRSKVCCFCDEFIKVGEEKKFEVKLLKETPLKQMFAWNSREMLVKHQWSEDTQKLIRDSYVQNWFDTSGRSNPKKFLKNCVLSSRSYGVSEEHFGCCKTCKDHLSKVLNPKSDEISPPQFAIVNCLAFGKAPKELSDLNEVELALISQGRIDKHIFSFTAGQHKMIEGWHSMYYNDIEIVNGIINWGVSQSNNNENNEHEQTSEQEATESDEEGEVYDEIDENSNEENTGTETQPLHLLNMNNQSSRKPKVCVVLHGPFTSAQKALTFKKTRISWRRLKRAINWLKKHNPLYANYELPDQHVIEPIIIDQTQDVEGTLENVEKEFRMYCVFPENGQSNQENGGLTTADELYRNTIERMKNGGASVEQTLLCPTTKNLMKDYEGDNLLRAFPLQFPYGSGGLDANEETHVTPKFLKHISRLSNPDFHRPSFCCVVYNIATAKDIVSKTYLSTPQDSQDYFASLTAEDINEAAERFKERVNGNQIGDMYLRKCKTISGKIPHTSKAAENAKNHVFSMITRFGLPTMMFTVTPDDAMNIRICIHQRPEGYMPPEDAMELNEEDKIFEFTHDCARIRKEYPGLCAKEYEDVIEIVIRHLIGWDCQKEKCLDEGGVLGKVDAWTLSTEEQGRKTLHGHFLIWVTNWKYWSSLLTNETGKRKFSDYLKEYTKKVLTTKVIDEIPLETLRCPGCRTRLDETNVLEKCDSQCLRNLRSVKGETKFGGKSIYKCLQCSKGITSEDLSVEVIKAHMSDCLPNDVLESATPEQLFGPSCRTNKIRLMLEAQLAIDVGPSSKSRTTREGITRIKKRARLLTGLLRNQHLSVHNKKCFKKEEVECRMKIPGMPVDTNTIDFQENQVNWYDVNGANNQRSLFTFSPSRKHADAFANIHNKSVSNVLGANTNVVCGVDGGSIMYVTSYTFKDNSKQENEQFCKAATVVVKKLQERIDEIRANENNNEDEKVMVMKSLLGSVFMSTRKNCIAAPMAAYLTRNKSRFRFSHKLSYCDMDSFFKDLSANITIDGNDEGILFLKSNIANYLARPIELESMCFYEFLVKVSVRRPQQDSLEWRQQHPSKNNLKPSMLKNEKVPMVQHHLLPNTCEFKGRNLLTEQVTFPEEAHHIAMEKYAKTASVLFIPFRSLDELKVDGRFLPKFRENVNNGSLTSESIERLRNMQDCKNSINSGRPKDALEQCTNECPKEKKKGSKRDRASFQGSDEHSELLDQFLNAGVNNEAHASQFHSTEGELCLNTKITTGKGIRNCGTKLLQAPLNELEPVIIPTRETVREPTLTSEGYRGEHQIDRQRLFSLLEVRTSRNTVGGTESVDALGTLQNIREYADATFLDDTDQKRAFEIMVSAVVASVIEKANKQAIEGEQENYIPRTKRRRLENHLKQLLNVNKSSQLICLLSGAGGTGKSHVINSVVTYTKKFFGNIGLPFNRRSIIVTACTGAAALSILGETTHSACKLRKTKIEEKDIEEYRNSYMLIVDEISFASKGFVEDLHNTMCKLKETEGKYGGLHVVFAGDFSQLPPVGSSPLYLHREFTHFYEWIHTFIELNTNHRFSKDPQWGALLDRFRDHGPTEQDIEFINKRVVNGGGGVRTHNIPENIWHATVTNMDRMAINDGIFVEHLKKTHSKQKDQEPPLHTICIMASNLKKYSKHPKKGYSPMDDARKDIVFSCCGEAHIRTYSANKLHDPFLKLYKGRPMMINDNIDVINCIANGAMCEFEGIELKSDVSVEQLPYAIIDGYYVRTVSVDEIKRFCVRMLDGGATRENTVVDLLAQEHEAVCSFPVAAGFELVSSMPRFLQKIKLTTFPVNISNARTVHKLQGRSLSSVFVNSWNYGSHWAYVVLSRVTSAKGLFLRTPLKPKDNGKLGMSEECRAFYDYFRKHKKPLPPVVLYGHDDNYVA